MNVAIALLFGLIAGGALGFLSGQSSHTTAGADTHHGHCQHQEQMMYKHLKNKQSTQNILLDMIQGSRE